MSESTRSVYCAAARQCFVVAARYERQFAAACRTGRDAEISENDRRAQLYHDAGWRLLDQAGVNAGDGK